ncbi:MAG TPA: sugar transferase [Solirubrobacteraceae bacterium]|nr:sugar transferase [Solirubrobacteraceae bacterium]
MIDEPTPTPVGALGGTAALPTRGAGTFDGACRALDVVVSAALLVVLAPLLALIALVIKLDSPGPAMFRQRRLGHELEPFTVHKFRTMEHGATEEHHRRFVTELISSEVSGDGDGASGEGGSQYKMTEDTRVTRCGRLLRRSSLDELPQLWNVLRGEMSLVGPRPPIPYEVEQYPPHWFARFAVKPGLTGLWQVNGRSDVSLEEMVALDVEYIRRRSLWLNLKILVWTVPAVLSTRGAW